MRRSLVSLAMMSVMGWGCLTLAPAAGAATSHVAAGSFNPANFTNPTLINNQYLPLAVGKQYVFEGTVDGAPHTVILTVTGLTKVLNGVKTRVVWDQDIHDGQLVEAELAFFAQDKFGTVWALGEYPEEFEDGVFVGAPNAWAAGSDGALAGIAMQAAPTVGQPEYSQGFAPEIDFDDRGQVTQTGVNNVCVPAGCFSNVVVVSERNVFEPGPFQLKFHAPGVGVVRIQPGGVPGGEELKLTRIRTLTGSALSAANYEAYRLDRRAYAFSEVFRYTAPALPG